MEWWQLLLCLAAICFIAKLVLDFCMGIYVIEEFKKLLNDDVTLAKIKKFMKELE